MRFLSEMWHPNSMLREQLLRMNRSGGGQSSVGTGLTFEDLRLAFAICFDDSLQGRQGMHFHPARTRKRPEQLRERERALVTSAHRGEHPRERHQHAGKPERRERGKPGRGQGVEGRK
jgi:hypothetical protein